MTTAIAHSNIALVKYWGKRDSQRNLPAAGSLSLTLDGLTTTTTLRDGDRDTVSLAGEPAPAPFAARVAAHLDLVAQQLGVERPPIAVDTANNFPTAAGLASSASGFAALTLAAVTHFGHTIPDVQLADLARRGSGSAARSIFGGWVELDAGTDELGRDTTTRQLAVPSHWDLRCVVLATTRGAKQTNSTDGMNLTATTSPYYGAWVASVDADLDEARAAVFQRDFERLATVAERSCMRMHASAIAADPAILYWNAATVELIHRVRAHRAAGHPVFFTIDAGPHVKVLCPPDEVAAVRDLASDVITQLLVAAPGHGARVVEPA